MWLAFRNRGIEGAKAPHQKVFHYYQALSAVKPSIARSDLAAAAVGIHTKSYAALQDRASASITQAKLQNKATASLQSRDAALVQQRMQLENFQKSLEEWEILLEKELINSQRFIGR